MSYLKQADKDKIWEKHRPHIEVLSQVNNSYIFVSELHVRYLFISPNWKEFFKYDPDSKLKTVEEEGYVIESMIHHDDLPFLLNLQKRVFDYLFNLPVEERANYKHIFEFRVLGPEKEYVRVILQYHILEGGETEDYILLLGVIDISPNQNPDEPVKFRLVNFKTGEIVTFPLIEETDISLTRREVEVLKLVNDGMISKEISNKLYISIHTVNRHRQNILEKMNVDNVLEAINYGRRLGLIG